MFGATLIGSCQLMIWLLDQVAPLVFSHEPVGLSMPPIRRPGTVAAPLPPILSGQAPNMEFSTHPLLPSPLAGEGPEGEGLFTFHSPFSILHSPFFTLHSSLFTLHSAFSSSLAQRRVAWRCDAALQSN
jgi:hypothetical protein